jgi:predicted CopG family antitoxin
MVRLRQIAVSEENYLFLKSLGKAGDSFNDVVTDMLKKIKLQRTDSGVAAPDQSVATTTHRKDGYGHR